MKTFIKNRNGRNVAVLIEQAPNQKGLVFIMHGLGGFKEQPHIQTFADAWRENRFTVVRFDTTNTLGESDGKYEDATVTNYYEDLEDIIQWATTQHWYQEPLALEGHSLGAMCILLYAEKYPAKVKALAPISAVISGRLSLETKDADHFERWKKTGWKEEPSKSLPGVIKRLKWSHMEDRMKYDVLPQAGNLTMPVFLLAGELDNATPLKHQKILFDALPGSKEIHTIIGAPHTFRDPKHLAEIKFLLKEWIGKLK